MCGRAKLPDDVSEIKLDLKIDFDEIGDYRPRWNAAPTSKLPVVVSRNGERTLTLMRWGLIPSWAKDLKIGYSTFNARAEGLDTRPAFRGAWQAGRRCLVIADGYYEWRDADKQPFAVALGNRGPMTFAGLWDHGAPGRRHAQVLHHHHHGGQRTPRAPARSHAGPAFRRTAGPAWLGEKSSNRNRTQCHAEALSGRGHDVLAGRPSASAMSATTVPTCSHRSDQQA